MGVFGSKGDRMAEQFRTAYAQAFDGMYEAVRSQTGFVTREDAAGLNGAAAARAHNSLMNRGTRLAGVDMLANECFQRALMSHTWDVAPTPPRISLRLIEGDPQSALR